MVLWGPLRLFYCQNNDSDLSLAYVMVPGSLTAQNYVFLTHQNVCGSTSVALWKLWTSRPGAVLVYHTGLLCRTLADQWYRNKEGTACGRVSCCDEANVRGKCSSSAGKLFWSAANSVHISLSCMGRKWYSQCIPHTSRGSWHQAEICEG